MEKLEIIPPMNDTQIRMYCLMLSMGGDSDLEPGRFPDIAKARELYEFICPSASTQEERKKPPRAALRSCVKYLLSLFRSRR